MIPRARAERNTMTPPALFSLTVRWAWNYGSVANSQTFCFNHLHQPTAELVASEIPSSLHIKGTKPRNHTCKQTLELSASRSASRLSRRDTDSSKKVQWSVLSVRFLQTASEHFTARLQHFDTKKLHWFYFTVVKSGLKQCCKNRTESHHGNCCFLSYIDHCKRRHLKLMLSIGLHCF